MRPKIEIFNGTNNTEYYNVLIESIQELSKYKSNTKIIKNKYSDEFIDFLMPRFFNSQEDVDLFNLINTAFKFKPFQKPNQKIILIDKKGLYKNTSCNSLISDYRKNKKSKNFYKQAIALSTKECNLDEFFAICCHELGHIYGATKFRDNNTLHVNGDIHCTNITCVMHFPEYNEKTPFYRKNKQHMYCFDCQEEIKRY